MNKIYSMELILTNDCNFRCTYCFEKGCYNKQNFEVPIYKLIEKINEFLESEFFNSNFNLLSISFWGGEPTLNDEVIVELVNYYKNNNKVIFFLVTNGYVFSNTLYSTIIDLKNINISGMPKFVTQISYDGGKLQELMRKTKYGVTTKKDVRENINKLILDEIPFTLKSTIRPDSFNLLFDAYRDFSDIWEESRGPNFTYFPTIDYFVDENTYDFDLAYQNLKSNLISISKCEIEFYKKNNRFLFSWFNNSRALCSAGYNICTIDINGDIFKCHGCLYNESKDDHYVSNILDKDFILKLNEAHKLHSTFLNSEPSQCKTCYATWCIRCNVRKYTLSSSDKYSERWTDYSIQNNLCEFFKLNSRVRFAIKRILGV